MSNLLTRSIIFAVSAALLAGIVFAAPALAALMPTEIENKITAAKILSPGDKILSLKIREEEVQISKNRAIKQS